MATILAGVPIDTTEETFERDVIQRSFEHPVVVDFWAEWCGPCRSLGPVIEKAVQKRAGQVDLVKVDTDANPRLSQAFGIQSIPAVKAFKDGKVVDEFIGALPPVQVERFLDRIVPSEADALIAEGGDANLRRALELEPGRADAAIPLARSLAAAGDREGALELLANVPSSFVADGLATRLRLSDDEALAEAFAKLDAGETEAGLDALIEAIASSSDEERKDELRKVVVGVLDELGPADPLARDSRRKLASALY
jgi:putative thioredoxin